MRHFATLLRHELRTLCYTPATYIAAFLFLIVMGSLFQWVIETYNQSAQETTPWVIFFQLFWLPVFFMVPLLTMRSFAEEKRMGTLENLMTTPARTSEIVLAKFFSAYTLYLILWCVTLGFNFILNYFAQDPRLVETGPLLGGFIFCSLSGLLFIAIGIFASTVTRSQLVAGILSFTLLFGLIVGSRYLSELKHLDTIDSAHLRNWIDALQIFQHAEDLSRGVLDSRAALFYLLATGLMLTFSNLVIRSKVWRG
jgi:ABC-2 type transport system permease protein